MPKLVFWGGWGGKFGWWRGEKTLLIPISCHFLSNIPQIDLHAKFHPNQMRNAKVSVLGCWGGKLGVDGGKNPRDQDFSSFFIKFA